MNEQPQQQAGRLRLRFSQLKHDAARRQRVLAALADIEGVISVGANAITGGMLIYYDAIKGNTRMFWDTVEQVLAAHHLQQDLWPAPRRRPASAFHRDGAAAAYAAPAGSIFQRSARVLAAAIF
ncbi:MAG: hypothetical protein V4857_24830 [Pseudomonadota bacterium]